MEIFELLLIVVLTAVITGVVAAYIVARTAASPGRDGAEAGRDGEGRRGGGAGEQDPVGAELQRAVDTLVTVAGEQLDARTRTGAAHLETRKELIDAELERMRAVLAEVTGLVQRIDAERAGQLGQVSAQLAGVARSHAELGRTTATLTQALTNAQARGQWGERMAEDVLRAAGFVEGVNYRTQVTTRSGSRPDVTFLLPGDRVVHMDVKFPLAGYLELLDADTEVERDRARDGFLKAARARIRELAQRGYIDEQDGTLDVVLLFIPNEQVYAFLHEHDPALLDDALAQRVVLCSPSTLFAVMAVLRQAVDSFALERASDEILQLLAGFADQWGRFTDQFDKLGRGLDTTQRAYEALASTRRTQLERQLDRVEELRSQRGVAAVVADDQRAPIVALGSADDAEHRTRADASVRGSVPNDGDPTNVSSTGG
ncbi:MAG: DNA recombination protein RmuC [Nitriliruptoraceae bacterium]